MIVYCSLFLFAIEITCQYFYLGNFILSLFLVFAMICLVDSDIYYSCLFEVMLDDENMKFFFIPKSNKSIDHNTYC